MDIREAIPEDDEALKELQAKCPQGTDLIVSVVNTPDFFARAKAYESYKVYIAYEGNHILGSTAVGLKNVIVNGEVKRVGYGFQAFVPPEHRRKGVASQLHQHRENYASQQGAVLFYTLVLEKNIPAMRYIERRGFKLHRTVIMPCLAVYKEMETGPGGNVRLAEPRDLPVLAELLNETWQGFELYEPTSAEGLSEFIQRTPGYSLDNLLILEERGKIAAFLGYLDWSQIMRITVEMMSRKMRTMGFIVKVGGLFRPMPRFVKPGDTLKQIMITLIGFRNPADFALLLRHLNNRAFQRGVEQIFFICEQNHVILRTVKKFIRIDTAVNLYVTNLQREGLIADKPVFINGVDM
jgi:GNAT superfamily N-acetyltransferase